VTRVTSAPLRLCTIGARGRPEHLPQCGKARSGIGMERGASIVQAYPAPLREGWLR